MDRKLKPFYEKMARFCAFQERSELEVKRKLSSWKLGVQDSHLIIAKLQEEGFLDQMRFAQAFCRGKFRQNKWGRLRIKHELKAKGVAADTIHLALAIIDPEEYEATLVALAQKKKHLVAQKGLLSVQEIKQKVFVYLLSRGFESEGVKQVCQTIFSQE